MKKFVFIVYALFLLGIVLSCDNVSRRYASYSDISGSDGVLTWLPEFFPHTAADIEFTSNIDVNIFHVYFSLNEKEGYAFEKALSGEASEAGRAFLANEEVVQAWCKMGKVSDEENERLYIVGKMGGDARRYYMKNVYTGKNADYTERVRLDVKKYCTV